MKVIVFGSTGATGKELVAALLKDSRIKEVIAISRRKFFDPSPKLQELIVDFDQLASNAQDFSGDIAYSCLGTTLKDAGSKEKQWLIDYDYQLLFASLCKANGVKHFVLLSALGVDEGSAVFYNRMKGSLEQSIKALNFDKLTIIQPSLILRPDSTRTMEVIGGKLMSALSSLGIMKKYAPISTTDLAAVILRASMENQERLYVLERKDF